VDRDLDQHEISGQNSLKFYLPKFSLSKSQATDASLSTLKLYEKDPSLATNVNAAVGGTLAAVDAVVLQYNIYYYNGVSSTLIASK
jgi:hypothetical protein